jgi:hypothetical protein
MICRTSVVAIRLLRSHSLQYFPQASAGYLALHARDHQRRFRDDCQLRRGIAALSLLEI